MIDDYLEMIVKYSFTSHIGNRDVDDCITKHKGIL